MVYTFEQIVEIWDNSPIGSFLINNPSKDIFDDDAPSSETQKSYLRTKQLDRIDGPNFENSNVAFDITPLEGEAYIVAGVDDRYARRAEAALRAQQSGQQPEGQQPEEQGQEDQPLQGPFGRNDPENNTEVQPESGDYSIMFSYKKTGVNPNDPNSTQTTNAMWRYKFTLPIQRVPGKNDIGGRMERLVDASLGNSLDDNSSSLLIAMVKVHLGLGSALEVTPEFDGALELALMNFQDTNRERLYQLGGWTSTPLSALENVPILSVLSEVEVDVDLPQGYLSEKGSIGTATYALLVENGFLETAKNFLERTEIQAQFTSAASPDDVINAFGRKPERQTPPTIGTKFINYTYVSTITKAQRPDGLTFEEKTSMFRQAVNKVFEYYGKSKTWEIRGSSGVQKDIDIHEKILLYQGRLQPGQKFEQDQRFEFTVEQKRFHEQIRAPEVDVLYGQELKPKTTKILLARIGRVQNPTARPSSVYTMSIQIRRDIFDRIEGRNPDHFGGTQDLADPETYKRWYKTGKDVKEKFDKFRDRIESLEIPSMSDIEDAVDKWADGQKRKLANFAENEAKNAWKKAISGDPENSLFADNVFARNELAAKELKARQNEQIPLVAKIRLRGLKKKIEDVAKEMKEHQPDIEKFKQKNANGGSAIPPLQPDVNLSSESDLFLQFIPALDNYLKINGYSLSGTAKDALLEVTFQPVIGPITVRSAPTGVRDTNVTTPKSSTSQGKLGYKVTRITYIPKPGEAPRILNAGNDEFRNSPWIYPSTMAYFAQVEEIYATVGNRKNACEELMAGPGGILFLTKYHYPAVTANYKKPRDDTALIGIKLGFNDRSFLSAMERLQQNADALGANWAALKNSSFKIQQGKVLENFDLLPELSDFLCDVEAMFEQFFDNWNFNYLMCDFLKCIPSIGPWNWSFKWSLPSLPKIPTFDPLSFVLPQIRIKLIEMIMQFLCKFLKNILEQLALPSCSDLLKFGLAQLSALNELNKNNPYANAEQKAGLLEKTALTLDGMGLSREVLEQESELSISQFLDSVSLVLAPRELCSLLQGKATDEVAEIVLKVAQSGDYATMSVVLSTIADVKKFFQTLGTNVDPFLCDRISEVEAESLAQELCDDTGGFGDPQYGGSNARRTAENSTSSPEELAQELADLAIKKQMFDKLIEDGDFSGLLPDSLSPKTMEENGLPGPYNNSLHDEKTKEAILRILEGVKSVYSMEIKAIVERLLAESSRLPVKGDETFDGIRHAKFIFYTAMMDNLIDDRGELERLMKFSKTAPFSQNVFDREFAIQQRQIALQKLTTDQILQLEYFPYGDEENRIDPEENQEEYLQLIDTAQQYIIEYISDFTELSTDVKADLRRLLAKDTTTISRIYPGGPQNLRRLHVRLITEQDPAISEDGEIQIVDSTSNVPSSVSVGYSELPFLDDKIKDCYEYTFKLENIRGQSTYFQKVYKEPVHGPHIEMRKEHMDITSNVHRDKLLRPGGFGALLIENLKSMSENKSTNNTLDVYADGENNIIPKIQGYVSDLDREELQAIFGDVFQELRDSGGNPLAALIISALIAGLAAASDTLQKTKHAPLYSSISDSINFQISNITKNSKYFSLQELLNFETEISNPYFVRKNEEGQDCYIVNPRYLSLQKLLDKFVKNYTNYANKPEHEPLEEDFQGEGPFSQSIVESLLGLYVTMVCMEMSLKGMFMFSNYGVERVFDQAFIIDYVAETVISDFESLPLSTSARNSIYRVFRDISGVDNNAGALRSLILKNLDGEDVKEIVDNLFVNKDSSFKEYYYNKMVENVKHVPSIYDAPIIKSSFFGDIPVTAPYFNLYDKFVFDGDDKEVIQKKINSGHFWLERFYRVENPEDFFEKAMQLQSIGKSNGLHFDIDVEKYQESLKEYISPNEMYRILFGFAGDSNLARDLDALKEKSFCQQVFSKLIKRHYANPNDWAYWAQNTDVRSRLLRSEPYKLMAILGMSYYEFGQSGIAYDGDDSDIIRNRRNQLFNNQIDGYFYKQIQLGREDRMVLGRLGPETDPVSAIHFDTEIDLSFRKGLVSLDEISERIGTLRLITKMEPNGISKLMPLNGLDPDRSQPIPDVQVPLEYSATPEQVQRSRLINWKIPYMGFLPYFNFGDIFNEARFNGGIQTTRSHFKREIYDQSFFNISNYEWIEELYSEGNNFYDSIPAKRKNEIIASCLVNFVEISTNWPRNFKDGLSRNFQDQNQVSFRPLRRISNQINGYGYVAPNNKTDDLFARISRQGWNMSYAYDKNNPLIRNRAVEYYNDDNGLPRQRRLNDVEIIQKLNEWNLDSTRSRVVFDEVRDDRHSVNTPEYVKINGIVTLQDEILEYYVSRSIRSARSVGSDWNGGFDKERHGILDAMVREETDSNEQKENVIQLQQQVLAHFKENLKIGARLMMGFKSRRVEEKKLGILEQARRGALDDGEPGGLITHRIKPGDFFGDMTYNRVQNRIGLVDDPYIFTRKRAFVGYADKNEMVNISTGLLNTGSIFYNRANSVLSSVSLGQDINANNNDLSGRGDSYESLSDREKSNIVFSIPMDEVVESVGCLNELYMEKYGESITSDAQGLISEGNRTSFLISVDGVYSDYSDKIYKNLLSLKKDEEGNRRIMSLYEENMYAEEVKKKHRVLFDLLFPMDRYIANHLIQNVQILNEDLDTKSLLNATKTMLWSLVDQTVNMKNMEVSITDLANSAGGPSAPKLDISSIMRMLIKMIEDLGKIAMRAAIRETVRIIDPGYRDMRKGYLKDPCSMKAGLVKDLIGPSMVKFGLNGSTEWNAADISRGYVDVKGCKRFVPINKFGDDIMRSIHTIVFGSGVGPRVKAGKNIKNAVKLMKNTITNKDNRYGRPTTFVTKWALSVGEIPSEDHRYLKKNNDCEDQQCESQEVVQPVGLCEDGENTTNNNNGDQE